MLKRQNVSEKINNVTMYASEEYWNTVGGCAQAMGQYWDYDLGLNGGSGVFTELEPVKNTIIFIAGLIDEIRN